MQLYLSLEVARNIRLRNLGLKKIGMLLIAVTCILRLNCPLIRQFPMLFYYCLFLPLVVVDLK